MLSSTVLPVLILLITLCLAAATEDLYKILQLDKSCNDRDLKRAYRTLSKKYHPDKASGDEQKFLQVAEAYEALSDPTSRKIYDQYGHEGLANHKRGGGQQAHNPFDLFSQFFGGSGRQQQGVRRGQDMEVKLSVPLRDFYTGNEVAFSLEKQQICDTCSGSGSADGVVETCSKCNGRGIVIQKHMLAPGMFQQIQTHCDACGGQGKTIKKPCKTCNGQKVVRKPIHLVAEIEPGMPKGHKIVFENEAEEHPDYVAGNLNVMIAELDPHLSTEESDEATRKHRTDGTFFRRKGRDLYWREILSLREAWMGDWTRNLTHLDGHIVPLSRKRGQVVQPGQVDAINDEGMPTWHDGHVHEHDENHASHGRLFVEYTVVLPDQMAGAMEKEFWAVWEKWRKKNGVDLLTDSGRPIPGGKEGVKDEL
ncbi:DnaJ-related protein scj1 [Lithohypha guttulata]|uniref:DnaJ-related protein scj1 n=1 Tax=Lithohypha guttulata TaxID=1690604 RepID=UPI002DDF5A46|nr:DnaJ- protein scj1 [Lithohypha guttulata]